MVSLYALVSADDIVGSAIKGFTVSTDHRDIIGSRKEASIFHQVSISRRNVLTATGEIRDQKIRVGDRIRVWPASQLHQQR